MYYERNLSIFLRGEIRGNIIFVVIRGINVYFNYKNNKQKLITELRIIVLLVQYFRGFERIKKKESNNLSLVKQLYIFSTKFSSGLFQPSALVIAIGYRKENCGVVH